MLRTAAKVIGWVMLVGILGLLPAQCPAATSPLTPTSISDKPSNAKARSRKQTKPAKRRLPKYFAQLKLDDEQRQQILEIQERYASQLDAKQELIDETRKQLDQLRKDQQRDYNRILKTSQKRRLKELRDRPKRSAGSKSKK